MTTVNEVSSNLLLNDVLTTDTLPGSATNNSILNPLSNSNSQNIGGSALIADSKTQPVIEPEKLSSPTDTLNSKNAITEPNSQKSDDSLIAPDILKSSLSGSASGNTVAETLSGSQSDTAVKDTLTGISKDAPLSAIKDDTITATDSLTNPQNAEEIASEKTPGILAEKESQPETPIAQNTSVVSEPKETTTLDTLVAKESQPEMAIAQNTSVPESKETTSQDTLVAKESQPEMAIAQNTSVVSEPKETTSQDTLVAKESQPETPIAQNTSVVSEPKETTTLDTLAEKESQPEMPIAQNTSVVSEPKETTTLDTLAEKESQPEMAIAQNTSVVSEPKETTSQDTLVAKESQPETPIAQNTSVVSEPKATTPDTLVAKESQPEMAIAQNTSVPESKETTTPEAIKPDNSTAEKPVATVADISQDSNKQDSTASSIEPEKKVADQTEIAAVEIPKELNTTSPKSEISAADNPFISGKFLVDSKGQVGIDFVFDGGLYKGQLAIFSLKGMEKFVPGSEEFIKETASRALSNSEKGHVVINDLSEGAKFTDNLPEGNSNDGTYLGVKTFAMTPGEEFGVMLVPNGTVQEVLNNPAIGGDKRPLFSMVTANPAEGFYLGQIADVTGNGKTFTMEDMRVDLGSDRDYNDFVFQVRGATGQAVNLDSVINADKDWRKTDMGQALIADAKPYTEPKLEPVKEDAKPVTNSDYGSVLDVPIPDAASASKEKVTPATNTESVSKTEAATSDKTVIPSVTIEEKKEAIAPVSTATESVAKTEVATSDKAVTPAVKIEEEKKAIAPVSTATESVSKTEVATSDTTVTPAVTIEEEKKAIAPVSTATESVAKTEVATSDKTVTPAVIIEEEKKAIVPVFTPNESVSKTEVATSDTTVTPAVIIEEEKKAIAPVSTATESVAKTEVVTSDKAVTPAVIIAEEKKAIAPVSTATESVAKTEVATSDKTVTPAVIIEEEKKAIVPVSTATESVSKTEVATSDKTVAAAVIIEEEKKAIVPISTNPEPNRNKDATTSEAKETASTLTEPQTKTNTTQSTVETTNAQNPVVLPTQEVPQSKLDIPANNSLSNLTPGVWTVDKTGQVSFDFLVDAGLYEGEIAIVNLSGMEQYPLNSDAFKQEAVKRALSSSELGHVVIRDRLEGARFSGEFGEPNVNSGEYQGIKTFAMPPGAKFAVMLVPNGTVQEISESPSLWQDKTPLFSIPAANPESQVMLADFTGKGNTFAWEDIPGNQTDRDFNDLIFAIDGATANLPELAANVNANTQWLESKSGNEILTKALVNDQAPAIKPVADVALTPAEPTRKIDLAQVFVDPESSTLKYEVVEGNSASLAVSLQGNNLQLTGLPQSGVTDVVIRATDAAGNSVIHNFAVTNSNLSTESIAAVNTALTDLTKVINQNSQNFIEGLSSDAAAESLANLTTLLEQYPDALSLFNKPDSLAKLGISDSNIPTIKQLLQSPEVAAEFGLSVSLGEALSHPDSTGFDEFLLNADEAISLLPSDAKQPKIGFIDFTEGEHVQRVTSAFSSINSLANYDTFTVNSGDWAEQLRRFVDGVKAEGESRAIANLSLDLSQLDDLGITTRYELTPEEQAAIQYARENNVLLVVASGNTGGVMSALGAASKIFDNIITVGAVNQFESKTDYSAYGDGLDLMAPGGSWSNDSNAFVGTSRSASYVTAAASLVWAANPDLSLQQVKQLLIDTAADLNAPGWDETTGFGLIDVKEAISRALLIEPDLSGVKPVDFTASPFSGEGRAQALARAAGDKTEDAIAALQNIQESLFEQWQTLADLGNPALTLADLDGEVKQKIAAALDEYQQVSTDAGITTAQAQQWTEALVLATQHYQIEKTRLQTLLQQQKEVQEQLAALGQQKSALETETKKMLADIQKQIGVAESDFAKAQAKLTNPFADVDDNLQINPKSWQDAATEEQESAAKFIEQSNFQAAEVIRYNNAANSINPTRWQVVGATRGRSGRTNQVWGWGSDPNLLKQKTQLQLQGQISSQNVQVFQQLAQQANQQNAALTQYAQFLDNQQNLNVENGNTNDANTVLELLKKQLADQESIANNYQKLVSLTEARRAQNQNNADWNNSQINRWQQVGIRLTGRSGSNTEPVYGWVHYPEHIAPRDQAQQLANQAAQERDVYKQLASQSQQQVNVLQEQVRKLSERVQDWPVLQQGIEYKIDANALRLQAEKDLLALHTPVQQQKLETLNLQIFQAEERLKTLENQKIPTQQQATDLTENRLQETQTEVEVIQTKRAEAQKDLQNFLETAGFLLPYRERLAAVQKTVEQLETEKLNVQSVMQQLVNLMLQTPSDSLSQQLNYWTDHLETLNQELDWAKLQQDQLALAIADSPERLAISGLIKELETASASINPTAKIDKLKLMEGSGANFLEGFDNLAQRLADAKAEDTQTQKDLDKLNLEYRELGLQKANLQDNLIPGKEKEIAAKEQEIKGTESAIAQTQDTLNNLENQLTETQDSLAQKSAEIQQQEGVIAATQSEITNLQNQTVAKNSEIQQQKSVAQGYQNQINQANAAVNSLEQQRKQHQANADYWNGQIYTWGVVGYTGGKNSQPIYGSIYNPPAAANRNAEQAAANSYAQQREAAQVNAVQLTATLQPQIAVNQQQIATLQQQQQSLTQQQQALNSQLANEQTQLQQLQKELQGITQQANNLESQINQTQNQLNGLNTQLGNQQQQREDLIAQLAQLNQQKSDLEQKLIEKYREIELTDQYFKQVEAEVNRLQNRLDLLNKAGDLEQKYQQNWQSWQEATQAQATATQALLEIRKAGQPDRDRLALLQQQLKDAQATLEQVKSLQKTIADTQQSLEFTKLQLGNQTLLLQSLIDRDNPLAALEGNYLNQAAAHQQKTWYWNGSSYVYNTAEAEAYRASLQGASFIADQRNRAWQQRQETSTKINELNQKISQQQSDIAQKQSELAGLGQSIPQIESKITTIQGEINTVNEGLELLKVQENKQTEIIQAATTKAQNLAAELSQTTELHSTALRQLIGFGILASESDVDFFATQVEPQVNTQLEQLKNVGNDLGNQIDSQNQQIANWEQELANTQDDVSKQALTNLIAQAKTQLGNLASLKASNQSNANELEDLLNQATEALTPLRQKQELEIRKKLESNDGRLESLQSQLNSENAADAAIKSGTVLDHVLLADQINQDLRLGVTNWTEQFLAGNQQTKELVTQQQDLSNSVDELIAYINDNLAEPDGNYNRAEANLRDGITTLGVVEIRADELDTAFTSTEDAIERIKLRIEQDAKLWEEIAPIATRYGVESQQLADFTKLAQKLQAAKEKFDKKQPDAIDFATQEVLPIAQSFIDQANGNPALATYVEKVQELLAKFNDLATKQAASEAKAVEVRQEWEDATNYDDTPINQINFGNKLVESRRGQDNLIYVRNSTDGGKTWTQWLHTGGGTNFDSIKTAVVDNKLFQSARGNDNQIWGRSSTDGVNWANWFPIGGAMTTDYSMDVVGKNLVFTVRNSDNKIYSRTAVNGTQWQNWEPLGSTMSDIVQDVVDGKFIQSYRGFDNQIYVRQSADGVKWETWEKIDAAIAKSDWRQQYLENLQKSDTHSLNPVTRTQYKDQLVEAVRGKDNYIYGRYSSDGGKTWSNWQYTNGGTNNDVKMVVANNALVQAVQGTDKALYVRQSVDGVNWNGWTQIQGAISDEFSVDVIGNKVVFNVRSYDKKVLSNTLIPNVSWSGWQLASVPSINEVDQNVVDGKVVQSYKGVDDRTYVRYSTDGLKWNNWETLENAIAKAEINQQYLGELLENSDQNPNPVTRTQYKDKLVEAVRTKDNLIYGRYSSDGGKTWSNWQYTYGGINSDVKMAVANNALIQVIKGTDNALYVRQSSDGVNWASWGAISGAIPGDFSVDVIDNKIVFGIRGSDNNFYSRTLIPNVRWTNWEPGKVKTLDGISQEVVDGKVVQTYQGINGQIYTRSTADGLTWSAWENHDAIAKQYQQEKEAQIPLLTQETSLAARPLFLADNSENGTAIDILKAVTLEGRTSNQEISSLLNNPSADVLLNAEAVEGRNPNQALFDKAKAAQASHEAQGYALLAQATWYEQQAAYNWAVSRKNGPYWYEERWVKGKSGKGHTETITHVDYNWILWQQYSQIFPQLRAQGEAQLAEADKWRKEKERIEPLKNQWVAANDAANDAEPPIDEARNFFAELEAARESIPGDQVQLASLENLLPTIQQQLEQAESVAAAQNAKVQQQWAEYDTNSEEYRAAIADILQRRGELNTKAIETQQQLADAEGTVERQTVALSDELESTKALTTTLEQQRQSIENQILELVKQGVLAEDLDDLNTNLVQVNKSLKWLNNKAAVLTAEQTALTQKRTMLTAQNEVILAEQRLLDAYINDPDADYSNLQQQLDDARAALAEAQRLAEQAEAASQALTASLQQLKTDLLAQNDEHLMAAKEHQTILKALVEATQSNANYTLQAAQKQQEVNNLEFQILQRLQTATAAGNQEAKALLDVAQRNDMATAAELYYRDYSDLASDQGGCAGGAGNANDQILANRYYVEMLNNRELQRRAQAQANAFGAARKTAEAQMKTLQTQQETAAQLLNDLNAKVAETQEERENKEQELAIAQARLDGITRIREQTEQTFIQLVTLEKLNLAQAQLEQEIAQSHQAEIDEAVQDRLERDRLELERKRLETTAKIEQLKQLQAEDDLRQSLNNVRGDLGLATLDQTEDPMQLQTQLAGLLTSLKDLETQQPDLPDNVKALLAEARGDINLALQGKEAANIQESLLSAMDGMIGQIESYKSEINKIDLDEQLDNELLQTAQTDLQGASQQFLKELQLAEALSGEKQIINPLYEEVLNKIALAEQAVEISSDLAKQGKEMLDQIIEQRIEQRKFRKKMFWNKILGIISGVIGLLSAITFFIPGLQPLSIILGAASAGINAIQSIINGDWLGGIFSIVMAGVNVVTAGMGNALTKGAQLAIKGLQSVAAGAFNGVRSMMSGDNIMGFLQILGGVAGAASSGLSSFIGQCPSMIQQMMVQVFNSLQSVPTMIYSGIKSIQNGDWFSAIGNIFNSVITLGTNFAGVFNSTAGKVFEYLGKIGNTGLAIGGAIKEGSIEGWLSGITSIIGMWGPDIANLVDRLNGEPIDPTYYEYSEEPLAPGQTCSASG